MPGDDGAGLFEPIVTPDDVLAATSDRAWVQAMLDTESALARAEEAEGVVPAGTAAAVAAVADAGLYDLAALGRAARPGGNPVIPLVESLREKVEPPFADRIHWGATSQDVLDTATVLVATRTSMLIEEDLSGASDACAALADRHRATLMAGRTLLQQALPTTFGLKAAGWLVGLDRAGAGLGWARGQLGVELGGAVGTLASLGGDGPAVAAGVAAALGLAVPPVPWHTDRTSIAQLAAALGVVAGAGAKVALDIALLMQTEVGEALEPAAAGRGGSSTLPHKRNPVAAAAVAAAHRRAGALVSVMLGAMAQEHERAVGGWQAEWETLTDLLRAAGGVAAHVRQTLRGLEIDPAAMARNLGVTGGVLLSERIVLALAPSIGRAAATAAVQAAAARAATSGRGFAEELLEDPAVAGELTKERVDALLEPRGYLGAADVFIDRALDAHRGH